MEIATELAQEFAKNAAQRDRDGGTPKHERDLIRQSGLLKLTISEQYGGYGQPWSVALAVTRELAKADGSVAHLFGYHHAVLANFQRLGTPEQVAFYLEGTVNKNWFWGNTSNVRKGVSRVVGNRVDNHIVLNGSKKFTTGTPDADYVLISWEDEKSANTVIGVIPGGREGLKIHDDWDGIGQRQTGSGTVTFENVIVELSEVLEEHPNEIKDSYNPPLTQAVLTNIYLGNALGALDEAKRYIVTEARPYALSDADTAAEDPYIILKYGELWAELKSAESLVDLASKHVDLADSNRYALSAQERGEAAAIVTAANVIAGRTALDVTSRIFELMGTRSATVRNGFDRYWRNVRIHTLHNSVDYKLKNIGNWALNGKQPPTPIGGLHT
ncbi:FMNH2-dependent monooxygenase [Cohnella abietis]|uniref:Dibenzothiophene monooxygenase n=1 Tax=Cohnella abietis TaxID=2507935 RepID=A0A3T1DBK6_9BACL|nr:FMNH2-dependent monooxygenase [Cohnella abietis]